MGHKYDIPGSRQWKIITDGQYECWVCSREIYSIIFWSPSIGKALQKRTPADDASYIKTRIKQINADEQPPDTQDQPYIYGAFTNWNAKKMFEIREYCYNLVNSTSILQKCIDSGFIPDTIKSVDELEGADQEAYEKEKEYQLGLYGH